MKRPEDQKPVELVTLNQPPVSKKGREYWRSLKELAEREDFESLVKPGIPQAGCHVGCVRPARFPEADGRIPGPGWFGGLRPAVGS